GFGPSAPRTTMSLEEVEEKLQRQAGQAVHGDIPMQRGQNSPLPEKRMLSLAEVEAALLVMNRPPMLPMYNNTDATYLEQQEVVYLEQEAMREHYERERRRREKQRKLTEMVRLHMSGS